jgi:Tfp pilus assembly protein PilF
LPRAGDLRTLYGPEYPAVAITLTNVGSVQEQLGELAAASVTEQRALVINEAVYGPEHPRSRSR